MRPVTTAQQAKEVPKEGDTIAGKFIPVGISIAINFSGILRSQELFGQDSSDFRPERFLGLDEETLAKMCRDVELTFGHERWLVMFPLVYSVIGLCPTMKRML